MKRKELFSIRHERRMPEGNAMHLNVEMLTFEVEVQSDAIFLS